ncbi:MAG: acetylxylan esterase [Abitibacteriaceae bacterium]|nr:acetylxylan esterase [Abditibacteriaceae bacterium]
MTQSTIFPRLVLASWLRLLTNRCTQSLRLTAALTLATLAVLLYSGQPSHAQATAQVPTQALAFDANEFWREPTPQELPFSVTVLKRGVYQGVAWQAMVYTSEMYRNEPVRIFAYYAHPVGAAKVPAIVYIHGGGGSADPNRAVAWAKKGYACLAFDWNTYNTPLANWKQGDPLPSKPYSVFGNLRYDEWQKEGNQWHQEEWGHQFFLPKPDWKGPVLYRGVMAARRALTWMSQQPEVDGDQLIVEGQSWGGFMAQLVAGIDPRIKATVSSAASGAWASRYRAGIAMHLQLLSPAQMIEWTQRYDPASYAEHIKSPLFLMLGASDFFGSIDTLAEYWPKIAAPKSLHLIAGANHLFGSGIDTRADWLNHWFKAGPAFPPSPTVTLTPGQNNTWTISVQPPDAAAINGGSFAWTTSTRAYDSRFWAQHPLTKEGNAWTATFTPLLTGGPLRVFASVRDTNGHVVSAMPVVQSLPAPATKPAPTIKTAIMPILRTAISPIEHPEAWAKAQRIGPVAGGPEVVGEQSAYLRGMWDDKALYLYVKVDDPTPWSPLPTGPPFWDGDSIQLRLYTGPVTAPPIAPPDGQNTEEGPKTSIQDERAGNAARGGGGATDNTPTNPAGGTGATNNGQAATGVTPAQPNNNEATAGPADNIQPVAPTFTNDQILNINWYPEPITGTMKIFVVRGMEEASVVKDVAPVNSKVTVQKGENYTLVARVPWNYIDPNFTPTAGRSIRFALLANQGDILTSEWVGGIDFNGGLNVYYPETWGLATLQ